MSFLNPTYLWALLGLLIPIAIHLWSNKEGRTIKVGSIQFLTNLDVKQTNSVKLNELLLLLLRILIITVLVFILAEPSIEKEEKNTPLTYIVEPTLLKNANYSTLLDSLQERFPIRLLQSGFPNLDTYNPEEINVAIPNYWQLARKMQDLRTDSIVVFTNAYLQGFKGKRPLINKDITWIHLDSEAQPNKILEVLEKEDEVEITELSSDAQKLSFIKKKVPLKSKSFQFNETKDSLAILSNENKEWFPIKTQDSIAIIIYYEEELETTKILLESSFNAISKFLERPVEVIAVQDTSEIRWESYHLLVLLKQNFNLSTSQRALIYMPDSLAASLIEPSAKNGTFHLTKMLAVENVLEGNLPEQLLKLLDLNKDLESKIKTLDKRTVEVNEFSPRFDETFSAKALTKSLSISKYLWLLLMLLIFIERIFARVRKQ